jgi:adenylyl-sulfate kinase
MGLEVSEDRGFVLWLTGLSGAGKTTLAGRLVPELRARGLRVEVLDGDEVRTNLSKGLGFSKEDRDTNVRRIGYVARLLARNGVAAITAAISPYREVRREVRRAVEDDGADFVEVYVECPLEVLAERDVKGLYKRALAGEIQGFTGVSDPYEAPSTPDVTVRTHEEAVEASAERIIAELEMRGLLPPRFDVEELVIQGVTDGHEHRTDI